MGYQGLHYIIAHLQEKYTLGIRILVFGDRVGGNNNGAPLGIIDLNNAILKITEIKS